MPIRKLRRASSSLKYKEGRIPVSYTHLPPWLEAGKGENPALGLRGIRLSLKKTELFRIQLRAILRAAPYGTAAVMFPMVSSVEEVRAARALLEQCRELSLIHI